MVGTGGISGVDSLLTLEGHRDTDMNSENSSHSPIPVTILAESPISFLS